MFAAIKILIFFSLLTGVVYPIFVTGISQLIFKEKANGSLIEHNNKIIGSELIGQNFNSPKYFQLRPSIINYDPGLAGGATNLSATSAVLINSIKERSKIFKSHDLLTNSASGLDPHLSKSAVYEQVENIMMARGIDKSDEKKVFKLIDKLTEKKTFGFLGNERINIVKLNLQMDKSF